MAMMMAPGSGTSAMQYKKAPKPPMRTAPSVGQVFSGPGQSMMGRPSPVPVRKPIVTTR